MDAGNRTPNLRVINETDYPHVQALLHKQADGIHCMNPA
jgi:hypothetical protein